MFTYYIHSMLLKKAVDVSAFENYGIVYDIVPEAKKGFYICVTSSFSPETFKNAIKEVHLVGEYITISKDIDFTSLTKELAHHGASFAVVE